MVQIDSARVQGKHDRPARRFQVAPPRVALSGRAGRLPQATMRLTTNLRSQVPKHHQTTSKIHTSDGGRSHRVRPRPTSDTAAQGKAPAKVKNAERQDSYRDCTGPKVLRNGRGAEQHKHRGTDERKSPNDLDYVECINRHYNECAHRVSKKPCRQRDVGSDA